jgi:hypothetical protein
MEVVSVPLTLDYSSTQQFLVYGIDKVIIGKIPLCWLLLNQKANGGFGETSFTNNPANILFTSLQSQGTRSLYALKLAPLATSLWFVVSNMNLSTK